MAEDAAEGSTGGTAVAGCSSLPVRWGGRAYTQDERIAMARAALADPSPKVRSFAIATLQGATEPWLRDMVSSEERTAFEVAEHARRNRATVARNASAQPGQVGGFKAWLGKGCHRRLANRANHDERAHAFVGTCVCPCGVRVSRLAFGSHPPQSE